MLGPTHRTAGIATATTMAALMPCISIPDPVIKTVWVPSRYGAITSGLFIVFSIIGSLLPDADMPGSTYGRRFRFLLMPMFAVRAIIRGLGKFFKPFKKMATAIGHRGLFHAPLFWTLLFVVLRLLLIPFGELAACCVSGLYLGSLSHLFLDYISGGIPLLAPFDMKKYKPPVYIRTGSRKEALFNVLNVLLIVFSVYFVVTHFENGGLSVI